MSGNIFNIKRYAIHDGPGIRVTVFFSGCPLNCRWCHNPEARDAGCSSTGRIVEVDELVSLFMREKVFMDASAGGVTFSGGEPLMQPGFLKKLLVSCRSERIHTAVDTSGYASPDVFDAVIRECDLLLFDIKHMDDEKHQVFTGVSNQSIFANLESAVAQGREVNIRFPVVPGINDDRNHVVMMADYLRKLGGISKVSLLPYHRMARYKHAQAGRPDPMTGIPEPSKASLASLKSIFLEAGLAATTGA